MEITEYQPGHHSSLHHNIEQTGEIIGADLVNVGVTREIECQIAAHTVSHLIHRHSGQGVKETVDGCYDALLRDCLPSYHSHNSVPYIDVVLFVEVSVYLSLLIHYNLPDRTSFQLLADLYTTENSYTFTARGHSLRVGVQ